MQNYICIGVCTYAYIKVYSATVLIKEDNTGNISIT